MFKARLTKSIYIFAKQAHSSNSKLSNIWSTISIKTRNGKLIATDSNCLHNFDYQKSTFCHSNGRSKNKSCVSFS